MLVHIKYFASIREVVGYSQESVQTNALTVAQLKAELIAKGEPYTTALGSNKALRMAFNQLLISNPDTPLTEGAELAFFPPVTGG
jgi:molybdopterin synthase sulfur carrier subunit